jgi:hypothetical protein
MEVQLIYTYTLPYIHGENNNYRGISCIFASISDSVNPASGETIDLTALEEDLANNNEPNNNNNEDQPPGHFSAPSKVLLC